MAEQFLHGVEVSEISSGPRTIRTTKSSIIGLIGTAPDADNTVFPLKDLQIFFTSIMTIKFG